MSARQYATASGIVWAVLASFIKSVTDTLAADGILAVLARVAVYGVVIAGIAGTLLTQAALHYGPLAISQPFMVIVNPLADRRRFLARTAPPFAATQTESAATA
jgi:hypothetical protein